MLCRKPDILGLLASLKSDGRQTMSIYKFNTSRGSSAEKSVDVQPWVPPTLCKLSFVHKVIMLITILWSQIIKFNAQQETSARISFALHFIAHTGGRLYCSNPYKMAQTVPYVIIQVKTQAVIPKLTAGSAIFLRDLNCAKGYFTTNLT